MAAFKERFVAVNGSAGAVVEISATAWARRVEIVEQPLPSTYAGGAFTSQGCKYERPAVNNVYSAVFTPNGDLVPGETLSLSEPTLANSGFGGLIGRTAQKDANNQTIAATSYLKIISASVTATTVRVREYR